MKSSQIWQIVDTWSTVPGTSIQKFMMMLEILVKAEIRVEFDTPTRDPLKEYGHSKKPQANGNAR